MTHKSDERVQAWLARSEADAEQRGLAGLAPLLQGLARAVGALRAADWNEDAGGPAERPSRGARNPQ